jgi:hypothetical protein
VFAVKAFATFNEHQQKNGILLDFRRQFVDNQGVFKRALNCARFPFPASFPILTLSNLVSITGRSVRAWEAM